MNSIAQVVAASGDKVVQTLKHPSKRNLIFFLAILWINIINLYVFYHRHEALRLLSSSLQISAPINNYKGHAIPRRLIDDPVIKLWAREGNITEDSRHIDTHSSNYNDFFSDHAVNTIFGLSYPERCDAYFRRLYVSSDTWGLDSSTDYKIDMEYRMKWNDYKKKYKNWAVEKVASNKQIAPLKVDQNGKDVEKEIADVFDKLKDKAKLDTYSMRDAVARLRIFNRCYVESGDSAVHKEQSSFVDLQRQAMGGLQRPFVLTSDEQVFGKSHFRSCSDLQQKIYPWIRNFPLYQRHDGLIIRTPPNIKNYVHDHQVLAPSDERNRGKGGKRPVRSALTNNQQCWISEFKNLLNGKGIVIPFNAKLDLENTINLIHVLRAMGNKYPIQVVYYGNFKEEERQKLVDAAQRPFTDFPSSFSTVQPNIPKLAFDPQTQGFAKQELWLVDASTMIVEHFRTKMLNVPIRAFAAVANSFDEYILMDPTAVPLQNPQYFFDLPEYRSKGAYFYRARQYSQRHEDDSKFFNKIAPSMVDSVMFGIPLVSEDTWDLPFFERLSQVQDPRIAVINRGVHFSSVMTYLQLSMFYPSNIRNNNATEIWLGFAANGDNEFHFSEIGPAAVGRLTELSLRLIDSKKPDSEEICSTQVGHLDPHSGNKLVWIASGLKTCMAQNVDAGKERSVHKITWTHINNDDDLNSYYSSRVAFDHAIVPPFNDIKSLKLENDEKEPTLPWTQKKACNEEFFCAYSRIGGKKGEKDSTLRGQIVQFDSGEKDLYSFYGDIWVGND